MIQQHYITNLVNNSKLGRKQSYLELVDLYCEAAYKNTFKIVLNRSLAEEILLEVFFSAWQKIKDLSDDSSFENWLNQIIIITSYYKLTNLEQIDNDSENELSEMEKIFAKLSLKERIGFILKESLGASDEAIAKAIGIEEAEDAKDLIINAKYKLRIGWHSKKLVELDIDTWKDLSEAFNKDIQFGDSEVSFDLLSTYLDFKSFCIDIKSMFKSISAPDNLVKTLKSKMMNSELFNEIETDKKLKKRKQKLKSNSELAIEHSARTLSLDLMTRDQKELKIAKGKINFKPIVYVVSIVAILAMIYFYISDKSNSPWLKESPSISINNNSSVTEIYEEDVIKLDVGQTGIFSIPKLAKIKLEGNSKLKVIHTQSDNNKLLLYNGKLIVNSMDVKNIDEAYSKPEYIIIDNKLATIEFGPAKLEIVSEPGKLSVKCLDGWATLLVANHKIYLGKGYQYNIDEHGKPIAAYHFAASDLIINAIIKSNIGAISINAINQIVSSARIEDELTLIQLLLIVPENERTNIVDKLIELESFFEIAGRQELISLDKNIIDMSVDYIKWELLSN